MKAYRYREYSIDRFSRGIFGLTQGFCYWCMGLLNRALNWRIEE